MIISILLSCCSNSLACMYYPHFYLQILSSFFQGRKMSKTLGNVIDPLDTIKEFGTDALRFTISLGTAGQVAFFSYNPWNNSFKTSWHYIYIYIYIYEAYLPPFSVDGFKLTSDAICLLNTYFWPRTLICLLRGWLPTRPSPTNYGMQASLCYRICRVILMYLLGKL